MLTTILYFLLCYLLGSAGLYLVSPKFRNALHSSATGNTSILNGLRNAGRRLAMTNLFVEIAKPILMLSLGYYLFDITDKSLLLWGVAAALAGRMVPLYLRFRHGGKGTVTLGTGILFLFPHLWWTAIVLAACVLITSKLWPQGYRHGMTAAYLAMPVLAYAIEPDLTVTLPFAVAIAMTLLYGHFRVEDGDQGFDPLYRAKRHS